MKKRVVTSWFLAGGLGVTTLLACDRALVDDAPPSPETLSTATHPGLIYGRVTATDGTVYEGRLRWGSREEALWGHAFNGRKTENPWAASVSEDQLPSERLSIGAFGVEVVGRDFDLDLGRPFMARFGDITRIEPVGREILVTLKSGSEFVLDLMAADDLGDGLTVWDSNRGIVELTERQITAVDFLPAPTRGDPPVPLFGTLRTADGDFTGLIQWDREETFGHDRITARTAESQMSVRFDSIRTIERDARGDSRVTFVDGTETTLLGTRKVSNGHRGVYVDDPRFGRVLVSWEAFERIEFRDGGTGPAYEDFPTGGPITGSVTTRSGRTVTGRLIFDLDESEVTETLDAPAAGVDYNLPFGLIASVALPALGERAVPRAQVVLHSGEALELELSGDLSETNGGMLVFDEGAQRPEYVPWSGVRRIDLDRPASMYPTGDAGAGGAPSPPGSVSGSN